MEDHSLAPADEGDHDDNPGDVAADGADVLEPGEDLGGVLADVEVGQETYGPRGNDSHIRNAPLVGSCAESGCLAVERKGVEDTAARVQEGVAGTPRGCQDCDVDDMVQDADASILDPENPRGRVGVGLRVQKVWLAPRNNAADHERPETVEDGEAPDESPGGLGDVATGSDRLTRRHRDQLGGRDKSEAGAGKCTPVREEFTSVSRGHIWLECAWVFPVPESDCLLVWGAAAHDDETNEDKAHDGDQLDAGEPELRLAEEGNAENIQAESDEEDDGDPDGGRHRYFPVVEEDGAG